MNLANLAHPVEQLPRKEQVNGSSPLVGFFLQFYADFVVVEELHFLFTTVFFLALV